MARALVRAGAVTAMPFDINPEWVQADTASFPGGPLSAAVPGQNRPADQYLTGWTRDYVTVLAGPWPSAGARGAGGERSTGSPGPRPRGPR
jgi:hypothetical protein